MKNIKFQFGSTPTCTMTQKQMEKVKSAITILEKVVASPSFKKNVNDFNWSSRNKTTYNRFHLSNGMSNAQVWDCITNATNWFNPTMKTKTTNTVINIVPCTTRNEVVSRANGTNTMASTPITAGTTINPMAPVFNICLDANWMNSPMCTPVHIASCIMHEYCVCLGFGCQMNGQLVPNFDCTVPYACGTIVREVCQEMSKKNKMIAGCFEVINESNYNYSPCTTTFCCASVNTQCVTTCNTIDTAITGMMTELDCIENVSKNTKAETTRMETLTNCIKMLQEVKANLVNTSLDACETMSTPVSVREMTMIG